MGLDEARAWLGWLATANTVAGVLLAIGVAYEFISDFLAAPFEKTIEDANEREKEELRHAIAKAELFGALKNAGLKAEFSNEAGNPEAVWTKGWQGDLGPRVILNVGTKPLPAP